jgi:ribosome-associated toxin RatA of RatAB toxin-antitoxin module
MAMDDPRRAGATPTLTDEATERTTIDAPPEHCFAIALDFDRYPEWAADIKSVEVLERDEQGRGTKVRFRAAAMGQSIRYTLEYDYADAPRTLAWVQTAGDITRKLDGSYVFAPSGDGGTDMTYHLVAELKVPVVGFIKRRAENRILGTALRELKARAESTT